MGGVKRSRRAREHGSYAASSTARSPISVASESRRVRKKRCPSHRLHSFASFYSLPLPNFAPIRTYLVKMVEGDGDLPAKSRTRNGRRVLRTVLAPTKAPLLSQRVLSIPCCGSPSLPTLLGKPDQRPTQALMFRLAAKCLKY